MCNQSGRTLGRQRLEESTSGSKSERPVRAYLGQIYRKDSLNILHPHFLDVFMKFAGMFDSRSPPAVLAAQPPGLIFLNLPSHEHEWLSCRR